MLHLGHPHIMVEMPMTLVLALGLCASIMVGHHVRPACLLLATLLLYASLRAFDFWEMPRAASHAPQPTPTASLPTDSQPPGGTWPVPRAPAAAALSRALPRRCCQRGAAPSAALLPAQVGQA